MGVAWVFELKSMPGSANPPTTRLVASSQVNNVFLLHHSNNPDTSFVLTQPTIQQQQSSGLPPGSAETRAIADRGFELILGKFAGAGLVCESSLFEVVGNEYALRDFRFRVGNVVYSANASYKGVVVEVEYAASNIGVNVISILQEAIELFFPGQTTRIGCLSNALGRHTTRIDNYMPVDTLAQYLEVFLNMYHSKAGNTAAAAAASSGAASSASR